MATAVRSDSVPISASSPADFFAPFSRRAWVFALLAFVVAFNGLGAIGIFDLDEGLYSTASRQMLESGDWIVPHIGPDVRFAKPPLIYWLQAPSIWLFGPTAFAVRFPSAVCVVATALLLWWTLAKGGRERAGWLAALAFVGSPLALILARQGIIDALLGLLFTGALAAWLGIENRKKGAYLAFGVLMGLSILAKSTIGLVLPVGAFLTWQIVQRRSPKGWALPLLGSVVLALIIAAPWHLLMWRATGDQFWQEAFVSNQIRRAQGQAWGHVQPFWFYVPVLLAAMLPWSALVPVAWWNGLREARGTRHDATGENSDDFRPGLWAWWALIVFVFFSIAKSKLPGYIFPCVPALAVLVGWRLDELWQKRHAPGGVEAAFLALVPLLAGVVFGLAGLLGLRARSGAALPFDIGGSARTAETLATLAPGFLAGGALFLIVGIALWLLRRRPDALGPTLGAWSLLLALLMTWFVAPLYARQEITPLHDLARRAAPQLSDDTHLIVNALKPYRPSVRFVVGQTPRVHFVEFDDIADDIKTQRPDLSKEERRTLTRATAWNETRRWLQTRPDSFVLATQGDAPPANLNLQKVEERGDFVLYRTISTADARG